MKIATATGLVLGLAVAQPALAQTASTNPTGPYLGVALGVQFFEDDDDVEFDDGGSLGLQVGYRFSDNLRTELEAEGLGVDIDGSDDELGIGRLTASLYYDFQGSDQLFAPYFGGGLGVAGVAIGDDDLDDEDFESEFTWHAEAGVSLNFNPYVAIVPSYRYTWVDNEEGVTEDNVTSHAIRVGLRASF